MLLKIILKITRKSFLKAKYKNKNNSRHCHSLSFQKCVSLNLIDFMTLCLLSYFSLLFIQNLLFQFVFTSSLHFPSADGESQEMCVILISLLSALCHWSCSDVYMPGLVSASQTHTPTHTKKERLYIVQYLYKQNILLVCFFLIWHFIVGSMQMIQNLQTLFSLEWSLKAMTAHVILFTEDFQKPVSAFYKDIRIALEHFHETGNLWVKGFRCLLLWNRAEGLLESL